MNILCSLALGSFEEALDLKTIVPSMGNLFEEEMVKRWEDSWEPALAALGKVAVYAVVLAFFSATCWNGAVLIRFC